MSYRYAQSFYYPDRLVDGFLAEEEQPQEVEEEHEDEGLLTTLEPAADKPSVYSSYLSVGMVPPAYNSLVEQIPADYFLRRRSEESVKQSPHKEEQPIKEETPAATPLPEPMQKYQPSVYIGFQSDVSPAYLPLYERSPHPLEVQEAKPANLHPMEQKPAAGSRLVHLINAAEEPSSRDCNNRLCSEEEMDYTAVQGDAFRPVQMPQSMYQFDQMNDLVSYVSSN